MKQRIHDLTQALKDLIEGAPPHEVAGRLTQTLGPIAIDELAHAQQALIDQGYSVEDIQRASTLHTELVQAHIKPPAQGEKHWPPGHPIRVFMGENRGLERFLDKRLKPDLAAYLASQQEKDRQNLLADARDLQAWIKHYDRKENLFFPYLEEKDITAPPKVMWGVDDIIRQLIGLFVEALEEEPVQPKRVELVFDRLLSQLVDMIDKEDKILVPMLEAHLLEEDWQLIAQESQVIGYVFNKGIEGASNSDAATWLKEQTQGASLPAASREGVINLPSGQLTVAELTAMLNTLPTDLTFADSQDIVRYYSEGKDPMFTRTRTIIGRDLYLCHPPQLVPVIEALVRSFKSGEKDVETVITLKGNRTNLIRYYAVRDDKGAYQGTLEVTEEISAILDLVEAKKKAAQRG